MRREVETKAWTHQQVWQGDGVVSVFYEPLGRDGRVAPHLPTDKQADSAHQLQLCPAVEVVSWQYRVQTESSDLTSVARSN